VKLGLGVVIASVRPNRTGEKIARWFLSLAAQDAAFEPELLDLREFGIGNYEDPRMPTVAAGDGYAAEGTQRWAQTVAKLVTFAIVTPEYNHSFPGSLKNALDHVYTGWNGKPAGFISYGGSAGGARAVEQLRLVTIELQMAPVRAEVNIPFAGRALSEAGVPNDAFHAQRAALLLKQLAWWGRALADARAAAPFPAR
jgi:NAD(P)H-dependent FMN reductase